MNQPFLCFVLAAAMASACPAGASTVAGFEDLPLLPALTGQSSLQEANNASSSYRDVVWDTRLRVVGADYRVDPVTPGPRYGQVHSGQYFLTNQGDGASNDGVRLATGLVLLGAWFGRNEYYGFGAGADQVTLLALQGNTVLASVAFDLPELLAGEPEQLSFVDTSAFAALSGITGYRIDRRELNAPFGGHWIADDFLFATANSVPEPASWALLLAGLAACTWRRRR